MLKKFVYSGLSVLCILLLAFSCTTAPAQALTEGAKAPVFQAPASLNGAEFQFSLKEALSKGPVVVYFYPAAYTGGCDLEAKTFADHIDDFKASHTTIIGVSADDMSRLNSFSADPDFCAGKFPIASDPQGKIAATFGLKMSPPKDGVLDVRGVAVDHGFLPRTTFVLNRDGKILAVFSSERDRIAPDEHVRKSLEIVQKLL